MNTTHVMVNGYITSDGVEHNGRPFMIQVNHTGDQVTARDVEESIALAFGYAPEGVGIRHGDMAPVPDPDWSI